MFTQSEVASRFGVHANTVTHWLNRKENPLHCVRFGRVVRITEAQITAFLAANSTDKRKGGRK